MRNVCLILLLVFGFSIAEIIAKPKPAAKPEKLDPEQQKLLDQFNALNETEKTLKYQTGKISIGNNLATLNLSDKYRFLDGKQAETVLVDLWGNPPSKTGDFPLGMIVEKDMSLLSPDSWAVIITYVDDGHIEDSDAENLDYKELLTTIQTQIKEDADERSKQGFATMELVDWAEQPHYDKLTHKIYWAKNLKFSDSEENTLNYDVRILGRTGYLSMNAVASMKAIEPIKSSMTDILPMAEFNEGKRYSDFDSSTDKVAEYGLAALIAGGIAAKSGILKVVGVTILKFIKPIIIGVIALGGIISKLVFGKKSD